MEYPYKRVRLLVSALGGKLRYRDPFLVRIASSPLVLLQDLTLQILQTSGIIESWQMLIVFQVLINPVTHV